MYVILCGILVYANLEKVINIRSPRIIGCYCDATKTTKAVSKSVTANCSLVSVYTMYKKLEQLVPLALLSAIKTVQSVFGKS